MVNITNYFKGLEQTNKAAADTTLWAPTAMLVQLHNLQRKANVQHTLFPANVQHLSAPTTGDIPRPWHAAAQPPTFKSARLFSWALSWRWSAKHHKDSHGAVKLSDVMDLRLHFLLPLGLLLDGTRKSTAHADHPNVSGTATG